MAQIPFLFDKKKKEKEKEKGAPPPKPDVFTVSELQKRLRGELEESYGQIHVAGEISNYKINAKSGHAYFTLKDQNAQLACVMFRSDLQRVRHRMQDGLQVIVRGRVTIYEQGGQLQLCAVAIEPQGVGARQLEFQERVDKLRKEGLTADARKRKIPAFPRCIGVVTSRDGAALRDVLRTILRRDPFAHIVLSFAQVQGAGAAGDIARALRVIDESKRCEVILLCRGGGSIEDLWCFNEEIVARAIAVSSIPIVTGIGHETDTTIADLVADLRASTPTAAAEHVTPVRSELRAALAQRELRLSKALAFRLQTHAARLERVARRIRDPRGMIERRAQRIDELSVKAENAMRTRLAAHRGALLRIETKLARLDPKQQVRGTAAALALLEQRMHAAIARRLEQTRRRIDPLEPRLHASLLRRLEHDRRRLEPSLPKLAAAIARTIDTTRRRLDPLEARMQRAIERKLAASKPRIDPLAARLRAAIARRLAQEQHRYQVAVRDLEARSPLAILSRGYSLVFDERGKLLKSASAVAPGDRLGIKLHDGSLRARVEEDT